MSLDPDPIDQLLDRHGKQWRTRFVPPPLEGMLAVSVPPTRHRARWLRPMAAAVALLVVPLVTVVGISGLHQSATHQAGYLADLNWIGAVLQTDPTVLTIGVDVNATPYCLDNGLPDMRPVVTETATKVTIRARAFRPLHPSPTPTVPPGTVIACSLRGYMPMSVTVRLERPLGTRSLIDAKARVQRPVLDASTLLAPSWLPAGYADKGFRWRTDSPQSVAHEFDGPAGLLQVRRTPQSPWEGEKVLVTATVLGHPGRVFTLDNSPNLRCVAWIDSGSTWSICSEGALEPPRPTVSVAELLRIANSMR